MKRAWLALWPLLLVAQPRLASGHLESAAAGSNLAQQVRGTTGATWVGYTITAVPAQRDCGNTIHALEGGHMTQAPGLTESTAFLEGERTANILMRIENGEVQRIRVFSPSCQLDIAGLTLHWLTSVRAADSIAFIRTLTEQRNMISAVAAHADPTADLFLRETAESTTAARTDRDRAAHSLALTRGASGLAIVRHLLDTDKDERFRESLPGALALAPNHAGTSPLIDAARTDKNRKVRERAFFWLGRSKDPRAQKFVEEILAR